MDTAKVGTRIITPGGRHGSVAAIVPCANLAMDDGSVVKAYPFADLRPEPLPPPPPVTTGFQKGLNLSVNDAGMKHAQGLGCNAFRMDTIGGLTAFSREPIATVVARGKSYGLGCLPLVNDGSTAWSSAAFWVSEVRRVMSYASFGLIELWNEPYGVWYVKGHGGDRPLSAWSDFDAMVRTWKACADALIGTGVKLTMATEGKLLTESGGITPDTMLNMVLAAYQRQFQGVMHQHPAFGGYVLHTYTGDPNAYGKIAMVKKATGAKIIVTECGFNGQMTGAMPPDKEGAAITAVYGNPDVAGAYYYNQDRMYGDSTGGIAAALKAVKRA